MEYESKSNTLSSANGGIPADLGSTTKITFLAPAALALKKADPISSPISPDAGTDPATVSPISGVSGMTSTVSTFFVVFSGTSDAGTGTPIS